MIRSRIFLVVIGMSLSFLMLSVIHPAFAQTISMTPGAGASASAACVSTNTCFSPNPLNVASATTVTWFNGDTVSHYISSGNPSDATTGTVFDSGNLIKPGKTYQFTFANAGTFNYFCTVHPWMTGQVFVSANSQNQPQQYQHQQYSPSPPPNCPSGYYYHASDNQCYHPPPLLTLQTAIDNGLEATIYGQSQAVTDGTSITRISWDWGDGYTVDGWFPQSHSYSQAGSYTVKVTAYDSLGASRWSTEIVTVTQPTPQPTPPPVGTNIVMTLGAGSSATAGCVTANDCFSPGVFSASQGQTVTWYNDDTVSHYISSGNPSDATTGTIFDSGNLIKPGQTYQFTFANAGTFNYFCTVHPWMTGQVFVSANSQNQLRSSVVTANNPFDSLTATVSQQGGILNIAGYISSLFYSRGNQIEIVITDQNGNQVFDQKFLTTQQVSQSIGISSWTDGAYGMIVKYGAYESPTVFFLKSEDMNQNNPTPQPTPSQSPTIQQSATNPTQTNQQTIIPQEDSVDAISSDGLLHVKINYQFNEDDTNKKSLHWYIFFEDSNGQQIPHSNYAITIMQDGQQLLYQTANYAITGGASGQISDLSSFDPLGFKITYLGVGLQYADPSSWTGPEGDTVNLEIPKIASNNPSVGSVTVNLDKKSYNKGDLVSISGAVSDSSSGDSVKLELVDPSGNITELQSVKIQDDKTYSLLLTADDSIWKGAGTYSLKATYGEDLPVKVSFNLNPTKTCFLFWCW